MCSRRASRARTGAEHAVEVGRAAGEDGAVAVEASAHGRSLHISPGGLRYQHHVAVPGVVEQRRQMCQVLLIMHDDLRAMITHALKFELGPEFEPEGRGPCQVYGMSFLRRPLQ